MNTTLPDAAECKAMTAPTLFNTGKKPDTPIPTSPFSGLFARIVFDRPLDTEYTYAVPDELVARIGVGKRVEAPFGKGGKTTPGFCVGVTDEAPTGSFEVKPVVKVLDEDALVDDHLMKLTRWMAD